MGGVFRFLTAGESHGEALTAVIDGVPAGLPLTEADINGDRARRQRGYGRGGRMKIERDQVHILSGVRWGATLGSPITLSIANRDWENWKATMGVAVPEAGAAKKEVTRPRPGHADLAGAMKYGHRDIRNVLERSSARETTARVAVAGVAKRLLAEFGISILSHVTEIGGVRIGELDISLDEVVGRAEASEVRFVDPAAEAAIIVKIDDQRGRPRGGRDQRTARRRACSHETAVHAAYAAQVGGPRHQGGGGGGRRAQRRLCGAGRRHRGRGHDGHRAGRRLPRKVRWRRPRRDPPQPSRLPRQSQELVAPHGAIIGTR